jgi:fumarate reductase subunit D
MRYMLAKVVLVIFGIFFTVGALNIPAIIKAMKGPTDFFIGTLLGHAIFIVLAVFCFIGYKRIGLKAAQANSQISK